MPPPRKGPKAHASDITKTRGSVYTPPDLVAHILDIAGYQRDILGRHVIDNSCGAGAFLAPVVERYCSAYIARFGDDPSTLRAHLERFVHGVDLDGPALAACATALDAVAARHGLSGVCWDLRHSSSLRLRDFHATMDFVVGNPPYVRVHNLGAAAIDVRDLTFAREGMTDLYLAFFDIGLQMLADGGRLGLITPSSWLTSKAARAFREYLSRTKSLAAVVDLGHHQVFDATTYTMVALITRGQDHRCIEYRAYDPDTASSVPRYAPVAAEAFLDSGLFFGDAADLAVLRQVGARASCPDDPVVVRNGFATLADSVFIGDHPFEAGTIPIVKASTGGWRRCIFPYDATGSLLAEADFAARAPAAMAHLRTHRATLERRSLAAAAPWYGFGRSQALRDVAYPRMAVNSLLKSIDQLRLVDVAPGQGVYGGLYLKTRVPRAEIEACLRDSAFMRYIESLRKYKSGGYYTFSAEELGRYLNWKLGDRPVPQLPPILHKAP